MTHPRVRALLAQIMEDRNRARALTIQTQIHIPVIMVIEMETLQTEIAAGVLLQEGRDAVLAEEETIVEATCRFCGRG